MAVTTIKDLKKEVKHTVSMQDYVDMLREDEPTVVLRNFRGPTAPPCLDKEVERFDFVKSPRPVEDLEAAFGTKKNIPVGNIVNALRKALGPGGFCLHISDKNYTAYSLWELKEFLRNFEHTDLKVWIRETFDCDDFSQVLQGNVNGFFPGIPFGTIWYGPRNPLEKWGHSVNIFYCDHQDKIYLVEPQNDMFYKFNKKLWKPWMVIL